MDLVSTTRHNPGRGREEGRLFVEGYIISLCFIRIYEYILCRRENNFLYFILDNNIYGKSRIVSSSILPREKRAIIRCERDNNNPEDGIHGLYMYVNYILRPRAVYIEAMLGARNTHAVNWNECLVNVWDFRRGKGGRGRCRFASNISVKSLKFW